MKLIVIKVEQHLVFGLRGALPLMANDLTVRLSDYLTKPLKCTAFSDTLFSQIAQFESSEGELSEVDFRKSLSYEWALDYKEEFQLEIVSRLNKLSRAMGRCVSYESVAVGETI